MLVRSQNVRMGELDLSDVAFVDAALGVEMKRVAVRKGDVLLNITGASIGRVTVWDRNEEARVNQHVCIVRPRRDCLDAHYLARLIARPEFQQFIEVRNQGGTRQALNYSQIRAFRVPLPPLSEQRRIADILDRADAIRRKREESLKLVDDLLQSVFLDMFGDPVTNPKGWPVKRLGEVLGAIDTGWSPPCDDGRPGPAEWGVLKLGAVTWGFYDDAESKRLPDTTMPRTALEVRPGDLLLSRKNTYDLVGAAALVQRTRPRLMLPDLIFRLRLADSEGCRAEWLWQALRNPSVRARIRSTARGASGSMPNIAKSRLVEVELPVPDGTTQRRFARAVGIISEAREGTQRQASTLDQLTASLTQRAFRGEL